MKSFFTKHFSHKKQIVESNEISDSSSMQLLKYREIIARTGYRKGYCSVSLRRKGESKWTQIAKFVPNIVPNGGRDWVHDQLYVNVAAGTIGANHIALTVDATGTDVTDTVLPGEITTGGLARALATTITHTPGTNVTTLQKTFSATATHTNVQMSALFNQLAIGGDMAHEDIFTPVTLNNGDDLQVTWTLTAG